MVAPVRVVDHPGNICRSYTHDQFTAEPTRKYWSGAIRWSWLNIVSVVDQVVKGRFNGGDGTLRKIRFLEPMQAAILSNHRKVPPLGLDGGEPGQCGDQWVERNDGSIEQLQGCDQTDLAASETFVIQTPTGGAFGQES